MVRFTMNVHHVLLFCFVSALYHGNTRLVSAKVYIFTGVEGGSGTVNCHPAVVGNTKFFCKNQCKAEDIIIKTEGVSSHTGKYSMTYRNDTSGFGFLSVTIRNLSNSDSGFYKCGLGKNLVPDSYNELDIRVSVEEAPLDKNSGFAVTNVAGEVVNRGCTKAVFGKHKFFCKGECTKQEDILIETDGIRAQSGRYAIEYKAGSIYGLYVTINQATKSDTGRYKCGYGKALDPDSQNTFPIIVIDETQAEVEQELNDQLSATSDDHHHAGYFLPLVVCVSLIGVMLLVIFLLLLYVRKTRRMDMSATFPVIYNKLAPASTCDDNTYENSEYQG